MCLSASFFRFNILCGLNVLCCLDVMIEQSLCVCVCVCVFQVSVSQGERFVILIVLVSWLLSQAAADLLPQ